jgi:hypothetical protein
LIWGASLSRRAVMVEPSQGLVQELELLGYAVEQVDSVQLSTAVQGADVALLNWKALAALGADGLATLRKRSPETAVIGTEPHDIPGTDLDLDPQMLPAESAEKVGRAVDRRGAMFSGLDNPIKAPILVVDDDAGVRKAVSKTLRQGGWDVTSVPSVQNAIDVLRSKAIHVVVTDLKMPGLNGNDLLCFTRSFNAQEERLRVAHRVATDTICPGNARDYAYRGPGRPTQAGPSVPWRRSGFSG